MAVLSPSAISCLFIYFWHLVISCSGRKHASRGVLLNWLDCQPPLKSYNKKEGRLPLSPRLFVSGYSFGFSFQIKSLQVWSGQLSFGSWRKKKPLSSSSWFRRVEALAALRLAQKDYHSHPQPHSSLSKPSLLKYLAAVCICSTGVIWWMGK